MTEPRRYRWYSLRFRLVVASVMVEALMLSVLVWNSTRITGDALQEIFHNRVELLVPLLNVSLANPLAQRDYAVLEERLKTIVNRDSLAYVEVRNELGELAASHGTVPETVQLDTSFEVADHVYDQAFDITLAGRVIGRARYGLKAGIFQATLASLRHQGILVASVGIVLTALLLATLGALLTRRLLTLARAAHTLRGGDYSTRVPVVGRDEVADTAGAFNAMADALARDITEREQAERALKESEERFRATFEQAAVGIAQVGPDGRWLQVNQKLCDIVGYDREELLQSSFQDITCPEDLDADLALVRRMLAGEIQTYGTEKRYVRKDGSLIWIYLTVGLVRQPTGEPKYFISVVEDISERKRAEAALQESQRTLATLISNLPGLVYRCRNDQDWTTEFVSDGVFPLTGYSPSDLTAGKVHLGQLIHPDDREPVWNAIQTALKEKRPYTLTYRLHTASGQEKWVWEQGRGIFSPSDELRYLEGFVTDITERKQAERQIVEYALRLERLSRQLLAAQETERRHIARELHDEIGQLLTVVKLDMQRLLRLRAPAELTAALKDGMEAIDRVMSKVRDLSLDLRPSMLDDLGLAPTLRWYVQRQAQRLGVEIQLSLPPAPPPLSADVETACFRIVQEALTNAARHAAAGRLEVTLAPTATGVELVVRDDGRGFDVAAARAKSLAGGGAGLLGMTERAELAGGRLTVESAPGRGTTVRARFPQSEKPGTGA